MWRMNDGDDAEKHDVYDGGELLMVIRLAEDTEVVFAQVPLLRSQLDALKRRSGTSTTKDALTVAVHHYLSCPALDDAAASDADAMPERKQAELDEREEGYEGDKEDWWWAPPVKRGR